MNTNVDLIIEIAKRITAQIPDLIHLFSGILFEAEKKSNELNSKGTIEAITWLCYESLYMNELDCDDNAKKTLEKIMMAELLKL